MLSRKNLDFDSLRREILGVDRMISTPFGRRLMLYADYTASGRSVDFIERYINRIEGVYGNSHTTDDATGRITTALLHQAEQIIKSSVNAGPEGCLISCGSGATAAIDKVQQLVGVRLSAATRQLLDELLVCVLGDEAQQKFGRQMARHQPVVFVGPYEHHSNEISWRESLATVVEVQATADGGIDLNHLERLLKDPRYLGRKRIGSFSAASNVTGMVSSVHEIAQLLHRHNALAFFDFAASAPYVDIDMNPLDQGEGAWLDAIFISPHKFLGGPGSSGLLVFNKSIYASQLAPSMAGGGTVDFVGPENHDFIPDIETREQAGTPGILQTIRAALVFELKSALGIERIGEREREYTRLAMTHWGQHPNIDILGNPDPERRIGIISFNIRGASGKHLHPRFVATLLNDLFGIQSRAGCSCAGPYGHQLLGIDHQQAEFYRARVKQGFQGVKPGWCRIGMHYIFDQQEVQYLIDTVEFVAEHGEHFLPLYDFDLHTGHWSMKSDYDQRAAEEIELSLLDAFENPQEEVNSIPDPLRHEIYPAQLQEAESLLLARVGQR